MSPGFDPEAQLPGAPDPWAPSTMPPRRASPPYLMTEMIAAEPALAARVAERVAHDLATASLVDWIRDAAARGEPITTTGCGTSEHAAIAAAELLAEAMGPQRGHLVRSRQALDVARDPQGGGVLLGFSHEGGTWATNEALARSRRAGARTALVTVSDRSPGAASAELVLQTDEQDQSWCHTVGYLSPVVVAAVLAAAITDEALDAVALRALLEVATDEGQAEDAANGLAACPRLIVAGTGIDYVSARELALKIEEGSGLPATALHSETLRHGHLAAATPQTGLVLILTDAEPEGGPVRERAIGALRSGRILGMPTVAMLGARLGLEVALELTPAGRLTAPEANRIRPVAEAILGAAIPLQLLAERLARARGHNPDPIGRDDPGQAEAAEA
jgi:glucosamine--fructose-6-phosphate aminotransferase (isomerizing)